MEVPFEEEPLAEPTKAAAVEIRPIAKDTVHRICSGQVVISLAVAVKELVENAIDANATLVEVKLREQGLDTVEVSDNGSGVQEHSLQAMTAKYHTSKLSEFSDLENVETFGFRGEALSSLCALCDMSIITRHKSSDVAIKVELNHAGVIVKRTPCARSIGTTVTLSNLFNTLPVRRKDFTRNIKKEFNKMCQILQAYCIVSKGVRILCSNQMAKMSKSVVMQTHGSFDVLANISAIFGSKQTADLLKLKPAFAENEADANCTKESLLEQLQDDVGNSTQITQEDLQSLRTAQFLLEGYVSACTHGAGRSTRDRQFYYVNSRPCEPKNITKVVNDIYHRYNMQQQPFIYLNVLMPRQLVDVNLTPDKRQLLVQNEKILLLGVKKALLNTYGNLPGTFKLQSNNMLNMFKITKNTEAAAASDSHDDEDAAVPSTSQQHFGAALSEWKHCGNTENIAAHVPKKRKIVDEITVRNMKLQKIQAFLTKNGSNETMSFQSESDSEDEKLADKSVLDLAQLKQEAAEFDAVTTATTNDNRNATIVKRIECKTKTPETLQQPLKVIHIKQATCESQLNKTLKTASIEDTKAHQISNKATSKEETAAFDSLIKYEATDFDCLANSQKKNVIFDNESSDNSGCELKLDQFVCHEICTSLAEIELELAAEETLLEQKQLSNNLERLRFKSEINPSQNLRAQEELEREVHKEDFARMEIVGQFNLGFILVKLDDDLFIVDQHASDEKYNFETLQRTTELQSQRLTVPQPLELTAVNEMVLLDHLEVFEKNGFKFEIDPNAPPTKKVQLLAKPFSKNWELGKDDIDELIFMLQDAPEGTICRPSRVRAMFASRACRKSVMIGQALSKSKMKMLIQHMGEIEQPWNCPHGRPTMRHLINTAMLRDDRDANINNTANSTLDDSQKRLFNIT